MIVPKPFESGVRKIVLSGLSWLQDRASVEEQGEIEAARNWLRLNLTTENDEQILGEAKEKTQIFSRQQALETSARFQDAAKEIPGGYYDLPDLPSEIR
jgi:hypothetical protein